MNNQKLSDRLRLMTTLEVCQRLRITRSQFITLIMLGRLPVYQFGNDNSVVRMVAIDVERYRTHAEYLRLKSGRGMA